LDLYTFALLKPFQQYLLCDMGVSNERIGIGVPEYLVIHTTELAPTYLVKVEGITALDGFLEQGVQHTQFA
jgi:hypothetical protein